MGVFRDLSRTPGVLNIIAAQLTARLPFGMLSIAMMLHIELTFGDYTSAGIVIACASIGQGISGPLTSRWMGVWGMRPVLVLTSLVCAAALSTIALVSLPLIVIGGIAFIMGLSTPPVTPAVRTIYPKMVPGKQLAPLFSLDAAAQEVIWVIGPLLAVFIATSTLPAWGLMVAVFFMLAGGAWFTWSPAVGKVRIPRARRRLGAVLTHSTVLIATILGFLFVASFTALELGIVSIFGHDGIEAGVVLGAFSVGSLIGGVTIGKRQVGPWSLFWRSLGVTVGTAFALFSFAPWWLCLVLVFAGLGVAPMLAGLFTMVSATVKFSETAEAYGWIATGYLIGAAIGSAIAGVLIDVFGSVGGILTALAFLVLTAIVSAATVRWIPDLRGRDAGPIPDTEPIVLPVDPPTQPINPPNSPRVS